jgi:hypothetical protein
MKRSLASSSLSTPLASPTGPVKRIKLTYNSTNDALKDINLGKEEASIANITATGMKPQLVETTPKGKGRYKLQWGGPNQDIYHHRNNL